MSKMGWFGIMRVTIEKAHTISYYSSIVTMSLSCTVCEI